MAEYEKKFLGLLTHVRFIDDEKVKIQIFPSGFPTFCKKKINYDEPKTFNEAMRKDKYLYEQGHGRESLQKSWKDKKNEKSDQTIVEMTQTVKVVIDGNRLVIVIDDGNRLVGYGARTRELAEEAR